MATEIKSKRHKRTLSMLWKPRHVPIRREKE